MESTSRPALDGDAKAPRRKRPYLLPAAVSIGLHLLIPLVMLSAPQPLTPEEPEPMDPVIVSLVEPPPPPLPIAPPGPSGPVAGPVTPAPPTPARAPAPMKVRPPLTPPPAYVQPLPAAPAVVEVPLATLSDAALVGARTAGSGQGDAGSGGSGSGAGGQPCDMVRRLQAALRQDSDIQAAVGKAHRTDASGKAILVWNGDWLRSPGQEGKGLAGVRQAIVMEVAFAPEACRTEAMRGLVLISLSDAPGSPRLVLGQGAWRWSDLLGARGARRAALTPRPSSAPSPP